MKKSPNPVGMGVVSRCYANPHSIRQKITVKLRTIAYGKLMLLQVAFEFDRSLVSHRILHTQLSSLTFGPHE
jgi:hypothetical protein